MREDDVERRFFEVALLVGDEDAGITEPRQVADGHLGSGTLRVRGHHAPRQCQCTKAHRTQVLPHLVLPVASRCSSISTGKLDLHDLQ